MCTTTTISATTITTTATTARSTTTNTASITSAVVNCCSTSQFFRSDFRSDQVPKGDFVQLLEYILKFWDLQNKVSK